MAILSKRVTGASEEYQRRVIARASQSWILPGCYCDLAGSREVRRSPDPAESLLLAALLGESGAPARFGKQSVFESPSRGRQWFFSAAGETPLRSPSSGRRILGAGPRP